MPADNRIGLHNDDRLGPSGPEATQHHPERPVRRPDQRPALLQERGKLLPKGEVLENEVAARTEGGAEGRNQRGEEAKHGARTSRLVENSSRILGLTV